MRRIYKYPIYSDLTLKKNYKVVLVGLDKDNKECVWVEEEEDQTYTHETVFKIFGTGHKIPEYNAIIQPIHVGSFTNLPFIWHVYDMNPEITWKT